MYVTLLFLAAMLSQNRYCREDNNFRFITLASVIVLLSDIVTPTGVSSLIHLSMVISILWMSFMEEYDAEDLLVVKFATKLFGKQCPLDLNPKFGTYGGGFSELSMRIELKRPILKRRNGIKNCLLGIISLLIITAIVVLGAEIISSYGWFSLLAIPFSVMVMATIMFSAHYYMYER